MNRKFTLPATPARARLLCRMATSAGIELSDEIVELAERDRIPERAMLEQGIGDSVDQDAVQFIHDSDFRCGIPTMGSIESSQRGNWIIMAAIKIAGIEQIGTISTGIIRLPIKTLPLTNKFSELLPYRRELIVVDGAEADMLDLVGKLFPRIIATGRVPNQLSLNLGADSSLTAQMGRLLHPAMEAGVSQFGLLKRSSDRSLFSMAVYPHLLDKPKESEAKSNFFKKLREGAK